MAKTVVSIEVGAAQTRLAVLEMGKSKQKIKNAVIFTTPDGAIEDGYIRDTGLFADQLSIEMRNAGITIKDLVFTISSNKVISREVVVTAPKEKLVKNIVRAEMHEYFPMDISEYLVAYSIIGHDEDTDEFRLIVYAAPENLIRCYYSLASEMRCNIEAIDIAGNSMYQWLKRSSLQDVSLVMQINENASVLTILDKGELGVQRTVGYGSCTMADALVDTHAYDDINNQARALEFLRTQNFLKTKSGDQSILEDEAWRKNELAQICESRFRRMEEDDEDEAVGGSIERLLSDEEILNRRINARDEVAEAARLLTDNVRRVMEYYTTKNPDADVQRVYITGSGSSIMGMVDMISFELGLPVEIYDVTEGVTFEGTAESVAEFGADFLTCFGATVEPLRLRPAEADVAEQKKNLSILAGAIFVAAVAILGVLIVITNIQISSEEKKKEQFEAEIQRLAYIEELEQIYNASKQSIDFMANADELTFSIGEQLNGIIQALEMQLPTRALVHSLTLNGDALNMNVTTVTKEEAAKLLLQLKTIPYIADVQVGGIVETKDEATNRTQVSFSVSCVLQKFVAPAPGTEAEGTEVQ